MTIKQIRQSGLLELYVLGDLDVHDNDSIKAHLVRFPELKIDLYEIENTFYLYAKAHAVSAPRDILQQVLNCSTLSPIHQLSSKRTTIALGISSIIMAGIIIFQVNRNYNQDIFFQSERIALEQKCVENNQELEEKIAVYKAINHINNQVVNIQASEKYQETKMILNTNNETKRNFIQFQFLPPLNNNQSYQLWSLKNNVDPIPLDVFENATDIKEVQYESGSNAYAITIEPKGGRKNPTLENLIGVFPMS